MGHSMNESDFSVKKNMSLDTSVMTKYKHFIFKLEHDQSFKAREGMPVYSCCNVIITRTKLFHITINRSNVHATM